MFDAHAVSWVYCNYECETLKHTDAYLDREQFDHPAPPASGASAPCQCSLTADANTDASDLKLSAMLAHPDIGVSAVCLALKLQSDSNHTGWNGNRNR